MCRGFDPRAQGVAVRVGQAETSYQQPLTRGGGERLGGDDVEHELGAPEHAEDARLVDRAV